MKLYNFQRESVKWLLGRKRAVLGSEMGTGKTAVAIRTARYLREKGHAKLIYVVCPASLKLNWEKEIKQWDSEARVQVVNKKNEGFLVLTNHGNYIIFSYEVFKSRCSKMTFAPDVLILDESHKVKQRTTAAAKNILTLAEKVKHVYLLTGTPMPNNIIDAWTTFNFCSYGALGSYWQFAYKYCELEKVEFYKHEFNPKTGKKERVKKIKNKIVPGIKNEDELAAKAKAFMRRDTIAEHVQELPEEQVVKIDLEHTKESKRYILTDKETVTLNKFIEGESLDAEEKEIAEHFASQRRELGTIKVKQAVEFISNLLEQGEQVVVFAHHRDVVSGIATELTWGQSAQSEVFKIYGDTKTDERQSAVQAFQDGKLRCLVVSIQAGGVGLTLTAAKVSVFVEVPWVPADFDQAKARIRRIGQKNFCTHYVLNYPLTLDETVLGAMQRKGKDINKFFEARV